PVLKRRIMSGQLASNDALPSTREMALALNVSRSTVVEAYDMLLSEGCVESRPGAPTRVAGGLCLTEPAQPLAHSNPAPKHALKADFHTG
ncbi:GntR family transcriptional regulator, partial [Citrobacter sp. AAK_AS5]